MKCRKCGYDSMADDLEKAAKDRKMAEELAAKIINETINSLVKQMEGMSPEKAFKTFGPTTTEHVLRPAMEKKFGVDNATKAFGW